MEPTGDAQFVFFNNAVCTYQIKYPIGAETGSLLAVGTDEITNTKATFIAAQSLGANSYKQADLKKSKVLSINFPNEVFLTVESTGTTDSEAGKFKFNVAYYSKEKAASTNRANQ